MGTGSREFLMTLVSVDRIEDVEDLVPPIPIPPPRRSLEDRLGPTVGLQERLDANYQNWLAVRTCVLTPFPPTPVKS